MTQTLTIPSLPPPTIFTHNETLHRISLPPLAIFLTDLSAPEQLIKLKDILDRYRTPKSYHRIDVREVDSSEIPYEEESEERSRLVREEKERERMGRKPVVLPPEVMVDTYLTQRAAELTQRSMTEGEAGERKALNGKEGSAVPLPIPQPMDITAPSPSLPIPIKSYTLPTDLTLLPSGSLSPPPLSRIHPIPPSAPKRRLRELRLDLRTLDAAALFALENWRRDVLGIERLEMEVPDSIWYKEPTPSPEPQKMLSGTGKKRGRPRKVRPSEALEEREDIQAEDITGVVEDLGQLPGQTVAEKGEQISGPSGTNGTHEPNKEDNEEGVITSDTRMDEDNIELHSTEKLNEGTKSDSPPAPPHRTPSPDVILHDAYDEKDDADPDFVPPPTPPPRRITRKARQSAAAADAGPDAPARRSVTKDITHDSTVNLQAGSSTAEVVETGSVSRKRGRSSLIPTPLERVIQLSSTSSPNKVIPLELQPVGSASSSRDPSERRKSTPTAVSKQEPISPSKPIPEHRSFAATSPAISAEAPARKRPRKSLVEVIIPHYKPKPRQSLPNLGKSPNIPRPSSSVSDTPDTIRAPRRSLRGKGGSVELVEPPRTSLGRNRGAEQRCSTMGRKIPRGPRRVRPDSRGRER